jgi:CubicO group peptidase (beta-lactamase class C family)
MSWKSPKNDHQNRGGGVGTAFNLTLFDRKVFQEYLSDLVFKGVPGIGVDVRTESEGINVYAGTLSVDDDRPIVETSHFGVACLGKVLVAATILQLQADGVIDVASPVADHLSELRSEKAKTITLGQLLSHTGGYYGPGNARWGMSRDEALQFFDETPQLFPPGTVFSEESLDYALLGEIFQRVVGEDIQSWINDKIFKPLAIEFDIKHSDTSKSFVFGHHFAPAIGTMTKIEGMWARDFWAPAASNLTMPLSMIAGLGRYLIAGVHPSGLRPLASSVSQAIRRPAIQLPLTTGIGHFPDWRIAAFGFGLATFQNGQIGAFATGRGQSFAIAYNPTTDASLTLAISNISAPLRSQAIDFLTRCIMGELGDNRFDLRSPPSPEIGFDEFTAGFADDALSGLYMGAAPHDVHVQTMPGGLAISTPKLNLITRRLQRGRLMLESNLPVRIGFFPSPDGLPALMLGMTAYKKVRPS